eukprot:2680881-Amphidinium_carterae.1
MASDAKSAMDLLLAQLSVKESIRVALKEQHIETLSALAFLSRGPPGQVSGKEFEDTVLTPIAKATNGEDAAAVRRLYLEAYTM